jgi:alanyl-tRNA synthetase
MDVFKLGNKVIHVLGNVPANTPPLLKKGDHANGSIELERRVQLAQHHTATHILNGACRKILGNHIWQAGAAKTVEKSRLDITHYENLTDDEIRQIEDLANRIVRENLPVYKTLLPKNVAEAKYGFRLYQGGAVPGKMIRVVEILNFDVEACGGTHLDITGDVGQIKILKSSKIQDGIIRIEFVAGKALDKVQSVKKDILAEAAELLHCNPDQVPGRAQELFELWKQIVKKGKQLDFVLTSDAVTKGDVLAETSKMLKVQPENLNKTLLRFKAEIDKKIGK